MQIQQQFSSGTLQGEISLSKVPAEVYPTQLLQTKKITVWKNKIGHVWLSWDCKKANHCHYSTKKTTKRRGDMGRQSSEDNRLLGRGGGGSICLSSKAQKKKQLRKQEEALKIDSSFGREVLYKWSPTPTKMDVGKKKWKKNLKQWKIE